MSDSSTPENASLEDRKLLAAYVDKTYPPSADYNAKALILRNGRWGACGHCPWDDDGRHPERCLATTGSDHNINSTRNGKFYRYTEEVPKQELLNALALPYSITIIAHRYVAGITILAGLPIGASKIPFALSGPFGIRFGALLDMNLVKTDARPMAAEQASWIGGPDQLSELLYHGTDRSAPATIAALAALGAVYEEAPPGSSSSRSPTPRRIALRSSAHAER